MESRDPRLPTPRSMENMLRELDPFQRERYRPTHLVPFLIRLRAASRSAPNSA